MFKYIIFIINLILFFSCKQDPLVQEIKVKYKLFDDVSPVRSILYVDEDIGWSHWVITDTSGYYPSNGADSVEHVFYYEGLFTIYLEASISGARYNGKTDVQIPPLANTFIIYGFYFTDALQFNINGDSLKIKFDYFDSYSFTPKCRSISKTSIENNDTVFFDKPIIYDITGFDKVEYNLSNRFNFWIKSQNESSTYFQTMFYLNEKYYQDRVYGSPNLIYLFNNLNSGNNNLLLLVDWINN